MALHHQPLDEGIKMLSKYFHFRTQTVTEKGGLQSLKWHKFFYAHLFLYFLLFSPFLVYFIWCSPLLSLSLALVFIILRFGFHFLMFLFLRHFCVWLTDPPRVWPGSEVYPFWRFSNKFPSKGKNFLPAFLWHLTAWRLFNSMSTASLSAPAVNAPFCGLLRVGGKGSLTILCYSRYSCHKFLLSALTFYAPFAAARRGAISL